MQFWGTYTFNLQDRHFSHHNIKIKTKLLSTPLSCSTYYFVTMWDKQTHVPKATSMPIHKKTQNPK